MIENKSFWKTLITGFLADELTVEEQRKLKDWLDASIDHRAYFQELEKLWFASDLPANQYNYNTDAAWSQFRGRIEEETVVAPPRHPSKRLFFNRLLPYAAVLVLGFIAGFLSLKWVNRDTSQRVPVVMSTPKGSKSRVTLTDGTVVFLNADSRLVLAPGFGNSERRVQLDGEAYFEVAKDTKRRFVVETDGVEVSVLGTKFNLQNYGEADKLALQLLEGAVQMALDGKEKIILKPNEEAVLLKATNQVVVNERNAADAIKWTEGKLVFDSIPFREIKTVLERNYGVEIQVHDHKLNDRIFFGEFENGETIEQVLNVITADGMYRYTIKKNKINIYKL
ncbi:FecR domain-containing protein [Parapedobacter sp. ISTM3]|uniref:FecR family protein n=1 Tax=Parapedobacter luteus TaxID=623280 RepID=A0A1T5D1P2_9SPHI|nr:MULTISPECIES: FecR family protein [Parapedobacter]MBK1440543.1 FecR domain-containing protein [Parapedobacter sp. ISTM3]SKB65547.1 FecR family protein [Parapedobacter luteus]